MNKSVAIIGGGFTGLTAAYDLSREGYDVEILEYSDYLGGLVSGFETQDGYPLEKVYHFLYKTDNDILDLLEELGIREKLEFHDSSIATYYDEKVYPFMTPLDLLKFTPLSLIDRVRAGLVVVLLQFRKNWEEFKHVTAYDWMLKWGGKNVAKVIWEPLLKGKFDKYYDKVAMTFLWTRIQVRALSKDKGDTSEKLGYFDGGWKILVDAFEKNIRENGAKIQTGARIELVERNEETGKIEIKLEDGIREYDSVIATVPSHVFTKLVGAKSLPLDYIQRLDSVDYIGAIVMPFVSTQEITPYYWININDLSKEFLVLLNLTALTGPEKFGGKYVYYIGDYVPHNHKNFLMDSEELAQKWFDDLEKIIPEFDRTAVTEHSLFKYKNAQHIADVDFEEKKLVPFKTPIDGIYMANFAQIYPEDRGTNYAVRDGRKVAKEVMEYLAE